MSSAIFCGKCGGIIYADKDYWTKDLKPCSCFKEPEKLINLIGWECPRCHTIHSPFIQSCDCSSPYVTSTDINTQTP